MFVKNTINPLPVQVFTAIHHCPGQAYNLAGIQPTAGATTQKAGDLNIAVPVIGNVSHNTGKLIIAEGVPEYFSPHQAQ
jgi:hypothetical protein